MTARTRIENTGDSIVESSKTSESADKKKLLSNKGNRVERQASTTPTTTMNKEIMKMANETKKTSEKKEQKIMKQIISDVKDVQEVIQNAADAGLKNIEQVHLTFAELPLKYVAKIKKIEKKTQEVQNLQKKAIGHIYDLARTLNEKVFDVADDALALAPSK